MTDRDRAAVHVHLRRVEPQLPDDGDALRRERLVQLDQVEVRDGNARARQQLLHGGNRADAHDARVDAGDGTADERAERLDAEGARLLLGGDHERRSAVVDARGVAGSDGAAGPERRLEAGELLERRVGPRVLVAHDVADGHELLVEAARVGGGGPAPVRLEGECVLFLARDAVTLGHVLAGLAHRLERKQLLEPRVREAPAEVRVVERLVAARERPVRLRDDERRA